MTSLRLVVGSEFSDCRKGNIPGYFGFYEVDVFPSAAWKLHSKNRHVLRRNKLLDRNSVKCYGSYISIEGSKANYMPLVMVLYPSSIFFPKPISSVRFESIRTNGLVRGNGIQSSVELMHEGGLGPQPSVELVHEGGSGKSVQTLVNSNHISHLQKLENRRSKWKKTNSNTEKLLNSNRVAKKRTLEPIPKKSSRSKYVRLAFATHDSDFASIGTQVGVDSCNRLLKELEQTCEEKALLFFDWMKRHGKSTGNSAAYNLALRVLSRKEDWKSVRMLLEEMDTDPECELNAQVFNSIIFVCAKRGMIRKGTQWFQLMLEKGVLPNVATIGMLMDLYRSGGNISEAEYVFDKMRQFKLHNVASYSAMITIYTRQGLYGKSEDIIHLMKEHEVTPNFENWLVQLNAYCQQGKLSEAESVFESIQKSGLASNVGVYNTLITGYGKVGNAEAAEGLFQRLLTVGLEPDEVTYRSMVECYGRIDNYTQAKWYYDKLRHSGFYPNSSNFYTMINLLARHGDEAGVIQTLLDMKAMKCQLSSVLSTLIQAYDRVGRMERVLPILRASFYNVILFDSSSCSILALAFVRNSLVDEALQILQEKRWVDFSFEVHLYHTMICSCKEAGRYEDAVQIFSQMPKSWAKSKLHIACSIIDAYSCMGRFNDAEALYLNLKSLGVPLDMIAYSIVVRMYVKSGSLDNACLVLDTIEKSEDIEPDVYLYRDMLRVYQKCNMHEKLANLYYRILKRRDLWDEAMYNCIINCCGHSLPVDEISRLFEDMIKRGYAASTITFNVMMDIYGKAGLLQKAMKVFQMARKLGMVDVISYNTLIAAYGNLKHLKGMEYMVGQMRSSCYPVSLEAYNCLLDAYGKTDQLEKFNEVLEKMRKSKCISDHYTYNIMINIYGKKGWIQEVSSVLAELRRHGLEPDLYSYNSLIKAYGIAGMIEEAVSVVKEMRTKGIEPDRITYVNVISALQRNEDYLEAVKWSLWLKQIEQKV